MNELDVFSEDKFQHAVKIAGTLAKSSIVPQCFRGKPEDVFACLVLGAELGFKPMQALNAIVMIQGSATLKAQTQLSLVRANCPDAIINITLDEKNIIATVTVKRNQNDSGYVATWDLAKAKQMGLAGRDQWLKQPLNMAKWRAISEALRVVFPDVLQGIYSTEELQDDLVSKIETEPVQVLVDSLKADAEEMYQAQRKPEDSQFGPLFLVENGTYRGSRLWEICPVELEEYGNKIRERKTQKTWEKTLLAAIDDFMANMGSLYQEQIAELNETQQVNP